MSKGRILTCDLIMYLSYFRSYMAYSTRSRAKAKQAHVAGKYVGVSLIDPRSSLPFPNFVAKVGRPSVVEEGQLGLVAVMLRRAYDREEFEWVLICPVTCAPCTYSST